MALPAAAESRYQRSSTNAIDPRPRFMYIRLQVLKAKVCTKCRHLFKVFREAGEARVRVSTSFHEGGTTLPEVERTQLQLRLEAVSREMDKARQALTEHLTVHISERNRGLG